MSADALLRMMQTNPALADKLTQFLMQNDQKSNFLYESEPERSELLHELSVRLDWAGISNPHNKVYIKPPKSNNIAIIIFLLTVSQLNKLFYCKNTASLLSKRYQDSVDAVVFALGIQTILRQFHVSVMNRYVKYLCMYVLSFITVESLKAGGNAETKGATNLHFLELFVKYSGIPRSLILKEIPVVILYHSLVKMTK
ncbi:PREDICTED: WASH complex subunit strumpellin-like [Wasmannia auropunctata]|uniref:WASH complex subunit strumpellin-like n=1 Tax=Wasmannia auropunctata TaxID=64793 RepID=UPI0005EE856C|nr:PREDICTED: WASH complex subunit strumpellin-like [Wasmannia auropunctata]